MPHHLIEEQMSELLEALKSTIIVKKKMPYEGGRKSRLWKHFVSSQK